jgi:hypothetical protein
MTTRRVELPVDLCQSVEERFAAQFGSLEQFLQFVLEEILRDDATPIDLREQRMVDDRLRDLGYL